MTQTNMNSPFKIGDGSYNRESGRKTLVLVGIMLALITVFSLLSFFLLFKNGSL